MPPLNRRVSCSDRALYVESPSDWVSKIALYLGSTRVFVLMTVL